MLNRIHKTAKVGLILVFLVILAGSVVRMTGSGMGCPDWPKCFGYMIPPTEIDQVTWAENKSFKEGTMAIYFDAATQKERLYVAKKDVTTKVRFNSDNWEEFNDHDYTKFVPFHTWVEYVNRLLGALSGLPALLLVVFSIMYISKDRRPFFVSTAALIVLGFVAWLGKKVVEGNLIPFSITIHMLGAVVLVGLYVYLIYITGGIKKPITDRGLRWSLLGLTFLGLLQIVFGSQVRELVDVCIDLDHPREIFIEILEEGSLFDIHRAIAWLVLITAGILFYRARLLKLNWKWIRLVLALVVLEVLVGIILAYGSVPPAAQPVHLLLAIGLFAASWYAWHSSRVPKH